MGHYRSEMGYEEQDRKEAEDKERRLRASANLIQQAIDEHGIARVLAEMLADPTMARICYRR